MITRNTVITLIGEAIGEVWGQSEKVVEKNFTKWLKEYKTPHARAISYQVAGPTRAYQYEDGERITYDDMQFGSVLTVDPDNYGVGVRFTENALDDMGATPFGEFSTAALVSAAQLGNFFREAASQTKDSRAAKLILNGDSTASVDGWSGAGQSTGWDGLALFSTAHTILSSTSILGPTTYSNLPTAAALSQASLQTAITSFEGMPTLEGHVRPLPTKYKLVVGPANRMAAYTAVETAKVNKKAGSADNDVPGLSDFDIQVIVNPFIGTTSTRWMLLADDARLYYWDRKKEAIEDEKDFETGGHKWKVTYRQKIFHKDAYGALLNLGA